jgi:hypothetical protein
MLSIPNPGDGEFCVLFIDDSLIIAIGDSFACTHRMVVSILEWPGGVLEWVRLHNCEFGIDKFQLLDLTHRRVESLTHPGTMQLDEGDPIIINNLVIKPAPYIKYLGIYINKTLCWRQQEAQALKKGQDWLIQFGWIAKLTSGIAPSLVRQLYLCVAVPRMLYAANVFLAPQFSTLPSPP